jgi:hypothetical protein
MVTKFVSATVSAALCLMSVTPAMAQDQRFAGFDAPRGATATLNLRVPLGREHAERASYGLTLGYGHSAGAPDLSAGTVSRGVRLADFRFSGTGLKQAQVASFDLAHLEDDERVMRLTGDGDNTLWIVVGLVAAGVAICLLADCFEGDDDSDSSSSSN